MAERQFCESHRERLSMISSESNQKCPICDGTASPFYSVGEYRMYKCCECFTVFLHPMPSASFLSKFYERFHEVYELGGGYELFEKATSRSFREKIKIIKRRVCRKGEALRLLDVGCGKGYFVKACIEEGIDAQGIDLSPTAINQAQKMNLPCRVGRVEDVECELPQFDVVTFWATIEHLPDPLVTLTRMAALLKPGGSLFLDTGIGFDWLDNLLPGVVQWYDPPQHLFVFSRQGVTTVLRKAGLTVTNLDPNFDCSHVRCFMRMVRGIIFGSMVRLASLLTKVTQKPTYFTRFALGNLMLIEAQKK